MKVVLSPDIGYCKGVLRSIEIAREATSLGLPVYTLGMIVHNEYTVDKLQKEGIVPIGPEQARTLTDCVLVVSAHGADPRLLDELDPSVVVKDATCPVVANIHRYASSAKEEGKQLVVLGDPDHTEVKGIVARAGECTVISDQTQIEGFELQNGAVVVAQSTLSPEKYEVLVKKIEERAKNERKSLVFQKTICYNTLERRRQSLILAKQVDAMLVVGSRRSSNTKALVELCKEACPQTYWLESAEQTENLKKGNQISVLGVTTGTSTPLESVTEVLANMSNQEEAIKGEEVNTVDAAAEVSSAPVKEEAKPITTMEEALQQMVEIKPGTRLKCVVDSVNEDGLVVNCGQKKDGFIAAENAGLEEYNPEAFHVGDTFFAKVIANTSNDKSMLALSKKAVDEQAAAKAAKDEAEKEMLAGKFDVVVEKVVKGGLLASKGDYTVFIPASHIELDPIPVAEGENDEEKLNALKEVVGKYVGQTITVKKLPPKKEEDEERAQRSKRIVASRKMVLLAERKAAAIERKKAYAARLAKEEQEKKDIFEANKDRFELNNIVPGTVKKFTNFGVFVNVYGFDCLCPSSEISWVRSANPQDVLTQGQEYEFLIIKVDPENFKVTLSYKQIQRQPYEVAAEKYPVGSIVKGKVQSIVKFGAFVSIEPGIDGLVHISNISHDKVESAEDVLHVGDEIEAKVISFNDNRIALSIKDLNPAPEGERRERPSKRKFDRPQQTERKPRRQEDNLMSEEERENIASYGNGSSATNNAFADMLKGLDLSSDGEGNE